MTLTILPLADAMPGPGFARTRTAATSTPTPDELDWLGIVPADVLPDGYADALIHQQALLARVREVDEPIAVMEARLAADARDLNIPPAKLARLAARLNTLRTVRAALPPIPTFDESFHRPVIDALAARWPIVSLGAPPMFAAEVAHHVLQHSRQRPPMSEEKDRQALSLFEELCSRGARLHGQAAALRGPLVERIDDRVRGMLAYGRELEEFARVAEASRRFIDAVDGERMFFQSAHQCPLLGGQVVKFEPIPFGTAWSLDWALAGNGRPPVAGGNARPALAGV